MLKQFAEITNDSGTTSNEATVNAIVKEFDGQTYVQIDGSDQFTPIETTVKLSDGERVMVLLKNHTATVTGNSTSPSVRTTDLDDLVQVIDKTIVAKIDGFEININEAKETADEALEAVDDAAKTATNYITGNSSGLVVGYQAGGTLGRNVQLTSSAVNVRNGSTTLASFASDKIQLGCNSTESVISLCGGRGTIQADGTIVGGAGLGIVSDEGIAIGSTSDSSVKVQLSPAGVTSFTSDLWLEANSVWIKGTDTDEFTGTVYLNASRTECSNVLTCGGNFSVGGYAYLKGGVDVTGSVIASTNLRAGTHLFFGQNGTGSGTHAISTIWSDGSSHNFAERNSAGDVGYFGYAGASTVLRGSSCTLNSTSGTAISSDERLKKDFADLERWEAFYDDLEPCAFKMRAGNSGRYHIGFKAQQVKESLLNNGLTTQDFGGFVTRTYESDPDDPLNLKAHEEAGINDGDEVHSLIYAEFIALNTYKIKKLEAENTELKQRVSDLESRLEAIENLLVS